MPTEDDFRCLFYRLIYISNGTGSDEYLDTWQFQAPKCHWKLTSIGSSLQNWALFHHWESFSTNSNDGKDVQISIYRGSPIILACDLQIRKSRIQGMHLTPAWMLVLTSLIPPVMLTFTMPGLDTFWLPCSYFPPFLDVNYLFRRWWSLLSISFLQRFMEVHRYAAVILIPIAHGFRK